MDNATVADSMERLATLFETQRASATRVSTWRSAATKARAASEPLDLIASRDGAAGLERVLGAGGEVAAAVRELCGTGRLRLLDRLEGQVSPEDLFCSVPGVGATLAGNVHARLGLETLEELELAARDGRLARVTGFGARRVARVSAEVAALLKPSMRSAAPPAPGIATLLWLDTEYRARAARDDLAKITPVRFNPSRSAWLPVLHAEADGFHFTAMYANGSRAHRLGQTRDWVVVYFERDGAEGQCTVVTEVRGARAGARVVRGRESERHAPAA